MKGHKIIKARKARKKRKTRKKRKALKKQRHEDTQVRMACEHVKHEGM